MAVKIKLARRGKIREPFYRVVVADARTSRNGRSIELVGRYQPKADPSIIEIDSDRVQYWLGVGAQPTEAVLALLKVTGDWQKFKGLPGAEGTLKPQPEKVDKRARYEAALAAIGGDDSAEATTPKKKSKKAENDSESKKSKKTAKADAGKADSETPAPEQIPAESESGAEAAAEAVDNADAVAEAAAEADAKESK